MTLTQDIEKLTATAKAAALKLALVPTSEKNAALRQMAKALTGHLDKILEANKKDLREAEKQKYPAALVDRLTLNAKRVEAMAEGLLDMVKLTDPVGEVMKVFKRPNGLIIKRVRVPIGVVGIIYESRPNVTSDCLGLCIKSGNAVVLKGGKEAEHSNEVIFQVLREALTKTNIPVEAVVMIGSANREAVNVLLKCDRTVDLIIPRGGEELIRFVAENSLVPVVKHYKGVCHTYVGKFADLKMARRICYNAKVQRPGVCNAMETMLVHTAVAEKFLPDMIKEFQQAGVEVRGCPATRKIVKKDVKTATKDDWEAEYLDLVLAVRVVDSVEEAIEHINTYGSHHSDSIVSGNRDEVDMFLKSVDSACVYANASTRFTDGFEFGFGAEVGISTDKLHARGPMALEGLTTYKYIIEGQGQVRE